MNINRIERLRSKLRELGADGALIGDAVNRRYFADFTGSAGLLYVDMERTALFVDFRYTGLASKQSEGWEINEVSGKRFTRSLAESADFSGRKLLIGSDSFTLDVFEVMREDFPKSDFVLKPRIWARLRAVKDVGEIEILRRAAVLADKGVEFMISLLKEGISEAEVAIQLEHFHRTNGAEDKAFDPIIAFGPNSAMPHYAPSRDVKLKKGDTVLMDSGARVDGYHSDITRTVFFGDPTSEMAHIYETTFESQLLGLETIRAGVDDVAVDRAVREFIDSHPEYEGMFGHGLGHGIGLEIHELPVLGKMDEGAPLEENMAVTVEPGIYIPGKGGVRIEDDVIVTADGCEILTRFPKELMVI